MTRALLLSMVLLMLANCGIERPLIRPKDIPAHDERVRKKRERLEQGPGGTDATPDSDAADDGTAPAPITPTPRTTPTATQQ